MAAKPKISVLTSVYKCEKFMQGFMDSILAQSVFEDTEFLLIDCNSPQNEKTIIEKYSNKFQNIDYIL